MDVWKIKCGFFFFKKNKLSIVTYKLRSDTFFNVIKILKHLNQTMLLNCVGGFKIKLIKVNRKNIVVPSLHPLSLLGLYSEYIWRWTMKQDCNLPKKVLTQIHKTSERMSLDLWDKLIKKCFMSKYFHAKNKNCVLTILHGGGKVVLLLSDFSEVTFYKPGSKSSFSSLEFFAQTWSLKKLP